MAAPSQNQPNQLDQPDQPNYHNESHPLDQFILPIRVNRLGQTLDLNQFIAAGEPDLEDWAMRLGRGFATFCCGNFVSATFSCYHSKSSEFCYAVVYFSWPVPLWSCSQVFQDHGETGIITNFTSIQFHVAPAAVIVFLPDQNVE